MLLYRPTNKYPLSCKLSNQSNERRNCWNPKSLLPLRGKETSLPSLPFNRCARECFRILQSRLFTTHSGIGRRASLLLPDSRIANNPGKRGGGIIPHGHESSSDTNCERSIDKVVLQIQRNSPWAEQLRWITWKIIRNSLPHHNSTIVPSSRHFNAIAISRFTRRAAHLRCWTALAILRPSSSLF